MPEPSGDERRPVERPGTGGSGAEALHVEARGPRRRAPVVVLLHHFGGSARTWVRVARRLAAGSRSDAPDGRRAHRCLALDLRGWGASPALGDGVDYALADAAAEVGRTVAARVRGPWWLVGHSMGGKVAVALAAARPRGLAGLVLVAPSPPVPEPMADAERARLAGARSAAGARATARRAAARPLDAAARRGLARDARRADPAVWAWWLARGSREDLSGVTPRVTVPVLVLAGARDAALGPGAQRRLTVPHLAGARLAEVAGAGHLLPLEAPDEVAAAVAAFVAGHGG